MVITMTSMGQFARESDDAVYNGIFTLDSILSNRFKQGGRVGEVDGQIIKTLPFINVRA